MSTPLPHQPAHLPTQSLYDTHHCDTPEHEYDICSPSGQVADRGLVTQIVLKVQIATQKLLSLTPESTPDLFSMIKNSLKITGAYLFKMPAC